MADYKTFGEMTRDEQIALFTAWLDDQEIEWLRNVKYDVWIRKRRADKSTSFVFSNNICYRIVPKQDQIDWSHVAPKYKYMARDECGEAYLFEEKPEPRMNE